MTAGTCIFCRTQAEGGEEWTDEHTIPEALGNDCADLIISKTHVCKQCNHHLAQADQYLVKRALEYNTEYAGTNNWRELSASTSRRFAKPLNSTT